jgi:tRNA-dependent cyclodipeptide synthase
MGLDPGVVTIIDRAHEIENHPDYQYHRAQIQILYENNLLFHSSVDATSMSVLHNAGKQCNEVSIGQAVHYLLSEIAFLEYAPQFFHDKKVAYFYHKPWEVFEKYVA